MPWDGGSQSFTVGGDGTLYIYDTYNGKLKTFQRGKRVGSRELRAGAGNNYVGISSMDYLGGSVYALDTLSN
jgi:hypothetical protein